MLSTSATGYHPHCDVPDDEPGEGEEQWPVVERKGDHLRDLTSSAMHTTRIKTKGTATAATDASSKTMTQGSAVVPSQVTTRTPGKRDT